MNNFGKALDSPKYCFPHQTRYIHCNAYYHTNMSDLETQVQVLADQVKTLTKTVSKHKEESDTNFLALERVNVVG